MRASIGQQAQRIEEGATDMAIVFGSGDVYITPSGGSPLRIGEVQEISVDYSEEAKELYGNKKLPIAIALGKAKLGGKIKMAKFQGKLIAQVLRNATVTPGTRIPVRGESTGTIVGAAYTVANPTGFDLSCIFDENGLPMKKVAITPAAGEYTVTAGGAFAFNASATGKKYTIDYDYASGSTGQTISYKNQLMGVAASFVMKVWEKQTDGTDVGLKFYAVSLPKLGLAFKNEDFSAPDLDWTGYADASDNAVDMYLPTAE
jgi:hypothetical protein